MGQEDEGSRRGRNFLSRVARFVSNPTTDWSDIDHPPELQEPEAQGTALKQIQERRRRNDFVRNREFNRLRRLMRSGRVVSTLAPAEEEAPLATVRDADVLLPSIDQLEQGMIGSRPQADAAQPDDAMADRSAADPTADDGLEQVAMCFAGGEFDAAQAMLEHLLEPGGHFAGEEPAWHMLMDLLRLTDQADRAQETAREFARRFGPRYVAPAGRAEPAAADWDPATSPVLRVPALLDGLAMAMLESGLDDAGTIWQVDWSELDALADDVAGALATLLQRCAEAPMELVFRGLPRLHHALRTRTTGLPPDEHAAAAWWQAQLDLLRILGAPDDFDEVALAYCLAHEVQPPEWRPPACTLGAGGAVDAGRDPDSAAGALPAEARSGPTGASVLRATLQGDLVDEVPVLESLALDAQVRWISFDCSDLRRMDFVAASNLLNWTMAQQEKDRGVVFRDVNALVSVFLGMIGLADLATVIGMRR